MPTPLQFSRKQRVVEVWFFGHECVLRAKILVLGSLSGGIGTLCMGFNYNSSFDIGLQDIVL